MSVVSRIFLGKLLRSAAILYLFSVVFGFLAMRLFGLQARATGPLMVILLYLAMLPGVYIGAQSSWLSVLPLRKRELLTLAFLSGLVTSAVLLLLMPSIFLTLSFLENSSFTAGLDDLHRLLSNLPGLWSTMLGSPCYAYAVVFSVLTIAVNIWLYPVLTRGIRLRMQGGGAAIGRPVVMDSRQQRRNFMILIGILAFGMVLREYLFSGPGVFLILQLAWGYSLWKGVHTFGLSGRTARSWRKGIVLASTAVVMGLGWVTWHELHSPVKQRQVKALLFLGEWGYPDRQLLLSILKEDHNATMVASLGEKYLAMKPSWEKRSFEEIITSKSDPYAVLAAFKLFPRSELTASNLKVLFAHLKRLGNSMDDVVPRALKAALAADLTWDETLAFIDSDNSIDQAYGLLKSRYFRDERSLARIVKRLPDFSDSEKLSALKTLSYLAGGWVGLDYYADRKAGAGGLKLNYRQADCGRFKKMKVEKLAAEDEGDMNICLRALIMKRPGWFEESEDRWVRLPVGPYLKQLIRRDLGMSSD